MIAHRPSVRLIFGMRAARSSTGTMTIYLRTRSSSAAASQKSPGISGVSCRLVRSPFNLAMAACGPVQAPPPSAVASGRWGAPVAGVMWPPVEGRATPRRRPQSKQVPPWRPRSSVAQSDPKQSLLEPGRKIRSTGKLKSSLAAMVKRRLSAAALKPAVARCARQSRRRIARTAPR